MLFHFLSSSYKRYHVHFSTPHRCVVFLVTYLFIFLFIYKLINVGLHVVRNASKNGRSAASGFGEKADYVIGVKRNAEFNAAINATIIYITTSGCRIHRLAKRCSTHLLFQHKPHSQQLLAKQPLSIL